MTVSRMIYNVVNVVLNVLQGPIGTLVLLLMCVLIFAFIVEITKVPNDTQAQSYITKSTLNTP
jgi:hypothetical protein